MIDLGVRSNRIVQNGWVVRDVEEAAARWTKTLGVGPFYLVRDVQVQDLKYRGQPAEMRFDVVMGQAGDVQIELIAPTSDHASAYRDLVPAGKEGFHHVGLFTEDYDAELALLEQQGFVAATQGRVGDLRFAYVDTSAMIGCMVELIENEANMRRTFDLIRAAGSDWDGTRPFRSIEELHGL